MNKYNKNNKITITLILFLVLGLFIPVFAIGESNMDDSEGSVTTELNEFGNYMFKPDLGGHIKSVDTLATIDNNGDMKVKQRWIFDDSVRENTEHYIVFSKKGLKNVKLKDVKVYQNNKPLELTEWNIKGSFEDKAGKYGWNTTDSDIELCFGIGNRIDNNTFVVEYTVEDALYRSSDGYVFLNWQFINDELSDNVSKARIEIQFPTKVKKMYGFGFSGYVALSSTHKNTVVLETKGRYGISSRDKMIALVEVEDNYKYLREDNKDRQTIYETSFEGSDYDLNHINEYNPLLTEKDIIKSVNNDEGYSNTLKTEENNSGSLWILVIILLVQFLPFIIIACYIVLAISAAKESFKMDKGELKDFMWRDEPPVEPNNCLPILEQSSLTSFTDIINYYIVKWVKEDKITVYHEEEPGILWFNRSRDVIMFKNKQTPRRQLERVVYEFIYARAVNNEITTSQLSKMRWDRIANYYENVYKESDEYFRILKEFGTIKKWGPIIKKYTPNEQGQEIYRQYRGLRNFLLEFTKMDEREVRDVKIWDYHLEMAALMGIAEQVQNQLKIYPEAFQQTSGSGINHVYVGNSFGNVSNTICSSGAGGRSSSGGGGGSSGGGSGGGSR